MKWVIRRVPLLGRYGKFFILSQRFIRIYPIFLQGQYQYSERTYILFRSKLYEEKLTWPLRRRKMRGLFAGLLALVLSACISSVGIASEPSVQYPKTANVTNDTVKFVVFSDLHIGLNETNNTYKMFHYNDKVLSDMVDEVSGMKDVNFVLIVGDLTKDSEPKNHKKAMEILSKLNKPYYITPGNHDVMKKGLPAENWGAAELVKNYPMPWHNSSCRNRRCP